MSFTVADAQRRHFETFGYVVFRGVFAPSEAAEMDAALRDALGAKRGGPFAGARSERLTPLVLESPEVFARVLDDDRLVGIAEGLLGEDCLFTGGNDGNLYVGDTPWHIDGGGPNAVPLLKTTMYLGPARAGAGCLSVVPGSHHPDHFTALHRALFEERWLDPRSPGLPGSTPVESDPGDVIAFHHNLWHAAWGGGAGRAQVSYSWSAFPRRSYEETWLHGYLARVNKRQGKRLLHESLYDAGGERRRRKLAKLFEMGL